MAVLHPVALRDGGAVPGAYTFGTDTYAITDGAVDCPEDIEGDIAEALADRYGVDAEELLGADYAETCDEVKSDGEVCGRDLPCPYHSED